MGFFSSLGKGFIRSTVNQVGRDTGKVISNSIYGNAHATPIRQVGLSSSGIYFNTETNQDINPEELREKAINDGFQPIYTSKSIWYKLFFIVVFGWSFIPSIVCFYKAYKKYFPKTIFYGKDRYIAVKSGYSTSTKKIKETVELPVNERDKQGLRSTAITYFVLAVIPVLFMWYVSKNSSGTTPAAVEAPDSTVVFSLSRTELDTVFSSAGAPEKIEGKTYQDVELALTEDTIFMTTPYNCYKPSINFDFTGESVYNKQTKEFADNHLYQLEPYKVEGENYIYYIPASSLPSFKHSSYDYEPSVYSIDVYYVPVTIANERKSDIGLWKDDIKQQLSMISSHYVNHVDVLYRQSLETDQIDQLEEYLATDK